MYPRNVQNISLKYVVLYTTQKRQIGRSRRMNSVLQSLSHFVRICLFYRSHNRKNFVLKFCTIVGCSIGYI